MALALLGVHGAARVLNHSLGGGQDLGRGSSGCAFKGVGGAPQVLRAAVLILACPHRSVRLPSPRLIHTLTHAHLAGPPPHQHGVHDGQARQHGGRQPGGVTTGFCTKGWPWEGAALVFPGHA